MSAWDAIVIGAGPAGSLSATLLAREGFAVLLVERRTLPRRKVCGGCLNASALASLDRAGLGPRVGGLGGMPIDVLRLHQHGRTAALSLPPGLAVSRFALDQALAAAAVEAGCTLLTETTATVEPRDDAEPDEGWRHVLLRRPNQSPARARAPVVVVADGLGHGSLREWPSFKCRVSAAARIGIGGEAEPGAIDVAPASITMAVARHGYAGAVEVEGGRVNIAAAVDPAFLRRSGGPAAAIRAIFSEAGVRTRTSLDMIEWAGTPTLTRRLTPVAARGIFVIGDAAGYVEPFTGEGMAWAFAGAEAVQPFVMRALRLTGAGIEREWAREYAATIGREQRWCRVIARCLRQPAVVTPLVAMLGRHPRLASPVLDHFSPRARPIPERIA
jgi:flavin-dependent dehydrogenase